MRAAHVVELEGELMELKARMSGIAVDLHDMGDTANAMARQVDIPASQRTSCLNLCRLVTYILCT